MKKTRFLVVDDEPINLNVIRTILEAAGHEVVTVSSGLDALECARAEDSGFDIILLDVHMPQLDGLKTAGALRRLSGFAETPIIFISARASQADQDAGLAAGGNHYLTKPFRRHDLLAAIAKFLPGSHPAAS